MNILNKVRQPEKFAKKELADFRTLYELAKETGPLIGGFMCYIEKSNHKGIRFKTK